MAKKYDILPPGAVKLNGILGEKLKLSINNRLKKIDYDNLEKPFRERSENDNMWRCEFWGKIVRSAINSYYSTPDEELLQIISKTVKNIMATQSIDGCISSYPAEKQMQSWDVWGRKYVLLGLIRYYEVIEADPQVNECCIKLLSQLMTQMNSQAKSIAEAGSNLHWALPVMSILRAVVEVWKISGDEKFLDYAKWLISTGGSSRHDIFRAVNLKIAPRDIAGGKAYEMMSCFQGLAEMAMELPDPTANETVQTFYNAVRSQEIFITGTAGYGGSGEFWGGGAINQTADGGPLGQLGETCVTTTWIHYCDVVLRLLGDETVADELEKTFYNALIGAMTPDGSWWLHGNPTPLTGGPKLPAADQMGAITGIPYGHDCCVAQGPEGLAMAPLLAVLSFDGGLAVNWYENMEVQYNLFDQTPVKLEITGDYPLKSDIKIKISSKAEQEFTLRLHIPAWWNSSCALYLPEGEKAEKCIPSKYFAIRRIWSNGSEIRLHFDYSIVCHSSRDDAYVAYTRGPLVLAEDFRKKECGKNFWFSTEVDGKLLCDYASAGNLFNKENTLRVWMKK